MQALIITLAVIVIALCVAVFCLARENASLRGNIVELHDILPASYKDEGYRYIGMRFQNEIKPYVQIDEDNNRIVLKVVKPT